MGDDIVARLRIAGFDDSHPGDLLFQAADEIERLWAVIERMPCNCLPHATPNDGMCNRCMALNKEARRG